MRADSTDELLLAPRDTIIVTQATRAHDSFPSPYDADDALAGNEGVMSAKTMKGLGVAVLSRGRNKQTRLPMSRGHAHAGFVPGLGDLGVNQDYQVDGMGEVHSARHLPDARVHVLSRGLNKQRALHIPTRGHAHAGFVPGLGDVPKPKMVRMVTNGRTGSHVVARSAPKPYKGGMLPGMGDFNVGGISLPIIALAIGAYFLLRK